MEIKINNIGNIKNTNVLLNGITLLAGVNGSGKSTVSKSLFSVFDTFHNYEQKIRDDKLDLIMEKVENYVMRLYSLNNDSLASFFENTNKIKVEIKDIIKKSFTEFSTGESIVTIIEKKFKDADIKINDEIIPFPGEFVKNMYDQKSDIVLTEMLNKNFNEEFHNQINNIYNNSKGNINLSFKERDSINIKVEENNVSFDNRPFDFYKDVVYIDDAASNIEFYYNNPIFYEPGKDHNSHLRKQFKNTKESSTLRASVSNQLNNIYSLINESLNKRVKLSSSSNNSNKKLDVNNYSSGMKTFYVIKKLLENGSIENNGVLILDEPEVHLHPEWQLKLSQLIVLLRKEFQLHILINTHSPYILNAIEVYSKYYDISDECNYYLCSLDDYNAKIEHVEETSPIYNILSKPLQTLEDLENDLYD